MEILEKNLETSRLLKFGMCQYKAGEKVDLPEDSASVFTGSFFETARNVSLVNNSRQSC